MNTERHEELAALAALELLSPAEAAELDTAFEQNPSLRRLVASLRETTAALAHSVPSVEPPAALKARLLAHIAVVPHSVRQKSAAKTPEFEDRKTQNQNPKLLFFSALAGWAAAACFALAAFWFGQSYLTVQKTNQALRDQQALTDLDLRSTQNQLEAERLIARRELAAAAAKISDSSRALAAIQTRADTDSVAALDLRTQLDAANAQLAAARLDLVNRELRIAQLDSQLKTQGDLANYKIATLASLAGNTPQALAVAVWNPASQQGVLSVQKLPALAADKDYQLWVIDPQYPTPVSGGTFSVDPATGEARINFRPAQSIKTASKFAISLERKGGGPKPEGPILFLGQ